MAPGFPDKPSRPFSFGPPFLLVGIPKHTVNTGVGGLTLLIFLAIIPLLDVLRRDLKEQWFSMWFQTRSSLLSRPKSSSVDHSLVMSSLLRLYPNVSFSTSSKLVGKYNGLLIRVRRSFPASRLLSWPKIRIFQVSPQGTSLVRSSRV